MKKEFNTTGICYPDQHYMMDVAQKFEAILQMIERGKYFVINRPRQFGKTTMLYLLYNTIQYKKGFLAIRMSFQGIPEAAHHSSPAFAQMVFRQIKKAFRSDITGLKQFIESQESSIVSMESLSYFISDLVNKSKQKIVLLIDEVDASSHFDAFLNFLAMLRTKYLDRAFPEDATFHSIVLAGVHDIKTLKFKMRTEQESNYNSPWNIAADFKVRMSFNAAEIAPMLEDYCQAENVKMDIPLIAARLYYYTSGYPFLVSKLCKTIAEDILPSKEKKKLFPNGHWKT